jgi:hypothetical protein
MTADKQKRNKKYYESNAEELNKKRRERTRNINEIMSKLTKLKIANVSELDNFISEIKNRNTTIAQTTPQTTTTQNDLSLNDSLQNQFPNQNQVMIKEINVNDHMVNLTKKYIERQNEFRDLNVQAKARESKALCFHGRSGTGKTMLGKAYAEKNNFPCQVFTCSEDIRKHDLLGSPIMEKGSSLFMPSSILQAIDIANNHESKTCVLILDEVNTLESGVMKNLNENMNWNEGIYVPLVGKKWKLNNDSKIIVIGTMNPNYTATNELNRELESRFNFKKWSDWTESELRRLFKTLKLGSVYTDCLINLNNQINSSFLNDELTIDQDSREMVKTIEAFNGYQEEGLNKVEAMKEALEITVISKYEKLDDPQEARLIRSFVESIFPDEEEQDEDNDSDPNPNADPQDPQGDL